MLFSKLDKKSKNHPLADICSDIEKYEREGRIDVPVPLYNSETGRPQTYAISVEKNDDDSHTIKGTIIEKVKTSNKPLDSLDFKLLQLAISFVDPSESYIRDQLDRIRVTEQSTVFESRLDKKHITDVSKNPDPRIPEEFNQVIIDYATGKIDQEQLEEKTHEVFKTDQYLTGAPREGFGMVIRQEHTADMEEDQAFYSIRQNGQLFEIVELIPDDRLFGRYDLDTENERTLVNAYTDYDEAVSDLMARVKPEYQNLATLSNEDLAELMDDNQQTL